jgi:heterodisulfide reductase subunit C
MKLLSEIRKNSFVAKVAELSEENIFACNQCGKCSAGCPMVEEMDLLPNQVIRLLQFGDEEVLKSKTIWLCASCFTCSTRCPKGVDLVKLMEALRLMILRKRESVNYIDISKMTPKEIEEMPQIALVSNLRKFTG